MSAVRANHGRLQRFLPDDGSDGIRRAALHQMPENDSHERIEKAHQNTTAERPVLSECHANARCLRQQNVHGSLRMSAHGLMGRMAKGNRGGHHDWVSRDYEDIDCRAEGCKFNIGKKCMTPSRCKISNDGRCEGFKPKPPPRGIDGD